MPRGALLFSPPRGGPRATLLQAKGAAFFKFFEISCFAGEGACAPLFLFLFFSSFLSLGHCGGRHFFGGKKRAAAAFFPRAQKYF
jgi:hypothetical protein